MNLKVQPNDPVHILSELTYIMMKLCHGNKQEKKQARVMLRDLMPVIEQTVGKQAYMTAAERLDYTNEELMHIERVAV